MEIILLSLATIVHGCEVRPLHPFVSKEPINRFWDARPLSPFVQEGRPIRHATMTIREYLLGQPIEIGTTEDDAWSILGNPSRGSSSLTGAGIHSYGDWSHYKVSVWFSSDKKWVLRATSIERCESNRLYPFFLDLPLSPIP